MRFHEVLDKKKIEEAIKEKFTGVITQLPPVRSRVARREREREIIAFEIIELDEKDVVFRALVQGGTYIRKLIHDLGEHLDVGAHMLELRRVRAGIILEDDKLYPSVDLYAFEDAVSAYKAGDETKLRKIIIPGELIQDIYPVVEIKKPHVEKILHGSPVKEQFLKKTIEIKEGERMSLFSGEQFLGVFKRVDEKENFARSEFTSTTSS